LPAPLPLAPASEVEADQDDDTPAWLKAAAQQKWKVDYTLPTIEETRRFGTPKEHNDDRFSPLKVKCLSLSQCFHLQPSTSASLKSDLLRGYANNTGFHVLASFFDQAVINTQKNRQHFSFLPMRGDHPPGMTVEQYLTARLNLFPFPRLLRQKSIQTAGTRLTTHRLFQAR